MPAGLAASRIVRVGFETPITLAQGESFFVSVEMVATIAFALSGVIEGARKRLDAVGICVVAGLAAFGGGTVRDILLDRRPLFWVQHAGWVWALLALCLGLPCSF
jgi:uncharacterized membrane protein YeiH